MAVPPDERAVSSIGEIEEPDARARDAGCAEGRGTGKYSMMRASATARKPAVLPGCPRFSHAVGRCVVGPWQWNLSL